MPDVRPLQGKQMIRKLLFIFLLFLALQSPANAQNFRWPEMRGKKLQTFDWNCSQTKLFPKQSLQQVVLKAIPPDDRGRLGTWGDRAYSLNLISNGSTVYFVPLVCGATGNCSWRLYTTNPVKYLGEVSGQFIYSYQSSKGWPTIITYTHMSASEGILMTYRFRKGRYRWLGDKYPVHYEEWKGNRMPRFLEKAKVMCKDYGG